MSNREVRRVFAAAMRQQKCQGTRAPAVSCLTPDRCIGRRRETHVGETESRLDLMPEMTRSSHPVVSQKQARWCRIRPDAPAAADAALRTTGGGSHGTRFA